MMETYSARAVGVDPTRKHAPHLHALEKSSVGRFTYLPVAIAATHGMLEFHESAQNESGSLLASHSNVRSDNISTYEVEALTLRGLRDRVGTDVDLLKLDLEGAEYALLAGPTRDEVAPFRQIFVEFHHHAISNRSRSDTRACAARLEEVGFESFTLDGDSYLFF
jgi:FkbM family methyltransferase